jgi:cobalt-zinc-cadmium resistance protein CzcA
MRQIVTFALLRRPLVVLLFFVFIVAGLFGFTRLNIEAYPDPVPPQVVIISQNPGQSAEEIERYVTIPVEVAMAGMPNLTSVRSTSLFGLSDVRVQFNFNYTYEQALQQVLNRLAQIDGLPAGVQPAISPLSPIGEIMRYRLVGPPGFSLTDLKTLQDWVLNRRFKRVPGVVDVTSFGGLSKSYNIVIDQRSLIAHRLTLPQVVAAIRAGNATVGAGTIRIGPQAAVVQGIGLIRGPDDLAGVMITANNGAAVRLRDVATIEVSNLPRLGIAGHEEDNDVVLATVLMRRGEQTLPTIRAVQLEVQKINAGGILPPGVRLVPLYDREDLVKVTTRTVVHNIIEGVLLILLVQYLFLGDFRGALVVAATVPFAFLFAIIMMLARGESANLLSLGALDFGLLVDATVIMVENIYRHLGLARHHGIRPLAPTASNGLSGLSLTVARAASEVDKAIFFSALIIIAAFIPLFTLGGIEGRIFGPMSKTYAYAIIGALLATFTITPALAALMLNENSKERDTPLVRALRWGHQRLYRAAMRMRALCLGLAALALTGSIGLLSTLGAEFLPTLEEGNLWVRATMPGTISLEEGNGTVNRIRAVLLEFPEVITATSQQGRPDDGTDSAGFFNAEFFLPLRDPKKWTTAPNRDGLVQAMQHRLSREFLGVEFSYAQAISDHVQEAASGVKGANAIKVFGPELDIIARTANQIAAIIADVPGVADLAVFRSLGQPTLAITIDRDRAARFGLNVDDINTVIQSAVGGQEAGRLYERGADRNFPINVRLGPEYRESPEAIAMIPVGSGQATLGDVADIRLVAGTSYIYREDATRYVPIRFSVRGRDPASTVREAQRLVAAQVQLPPGYTLDWVGEFRNLNDAMKRFTTIVPAAMALILVLLYVQFSTLRETLLVFGIVPMSIVGGVCALWVAGLNFSVPAAIGFLALFGITVMEGIIFLSHFNHLREGGMPWRQALDQAGVDRMRPVFMTCFASFTGLLPMALATGIGADVQKPLALVVVGGIGLVPLFILVTFPAMIDLLGKPRSERIAH